MRVFISGGTGFLGKNLAKTLLEKRYEVSIFGRNESLAQNLIQQGAHFIRGDLRDLSLLKKVLANHDACVHCAALSTVWGNKEDFFQNNVLGTRNLLIASNFNRLKRFVHISSPSIYFDFRDQYNIKEDDPLPKAFANHYAESKWLSENEVLAYHDKMECITLRPRGIIGAGDTALIPRLLRANKYLGIPCSRQGEFFIDVTHVDNVVYAICLSLSALKEVSSQAYNITNGEPMYLRSILEILFQKMNKTLNIRSIPWPISSFLASTVEQLYQKLHFSEPPLTRYSAGVLAFGQTLDINKAKKYLAYKPIKCLHEGLEDYVE
jgi:nucleoside-diphosphate-sugar epimerase